MSGNISIVSVKMVKEPTERQFSVTKVRTAQDAATVLREYIGDADREHFVILLLDTKHNIVGIHTVSIGSLDASVVHPREVFKVAILANVSGIIAGHNHPSGDPSESFEDVAVTKRLVEAGKLLGIDVLDHIIIGDNDNFVSFKARGIIQ